VPHCGEGKGGGGPHGEKTSDSQVQSGTVTLANSETWTLKRKAKEVLLVNYDRLRSAFQEAHVPGVLRDLDVKNKDYSVTVSHCLQSVWDHRVLLYLPQANCQ
jgi:hypothetical protein